MIYVFAGHPIRSHVDLQSQIEAQVAPLCHDRACSHRQGGRYRLTLEEQTFRQKEGGIPTPLTPSMRALAARDRLLADATLGQEIKGMVSIAEAKIADEEMIHDASVKHEHCPHNLGNGVNFGSHTDAATGVETPLTWVCFDTPLTPPQAVLLRQIVEAP